MLARLMFSIVNFAARKGLAEIPVEPSAQSSGNASLEASTPLATKERALRTGVRGETYAYWYLRRLGYVLIARNFSLPGIKGEIDIIGYDGPVLAFVEVKTRSASSPGAPKPEEAVNHEKRRNLTRTARQFLRARRIESAACRFDILAIETRAGAKPVVRLHKGAFGMDAR